MSTALEEQIHEYFAFVDEAQGSVDVATVQERRIGPGQVRPIRPATQSPHRPPRRLVVVAAAVATMLAVGGVALLVQLVRSDELGPVATTAPAAPSTLGALEVTDVIAVNGSIPERYWGTNRIVAAGGAVWIGIDNRDTSQNALPSALVRIDPTTKEITDEIALPAGVIDLEPGTAGLWALVGNNTVVRVDPDTRLITDTIALPPPLDLAWDAPTRSDMAIASNGLWVTGGDGIARIDLESFTVETFAASPEGDAGVTGTAFPATHVDLWLGESGGYLWGWKSHRGDAVRVDLSANTFTTFKVVDQPESNAVVGEGAIWAIDERGLVRLDLATGRRTRSDRIFFSGERGWHLVAVNGALWTVSDSQVTRYDTPSGETTTAIPVATGGRDDLLNPPLLATSDGAVWTITGEPATLTRIDTDTGTATGTVEVGRGGGLLAQGGAIWIAAQDGTITRVAAKEGNAVVGSPPLAAQPPAVGPDTALAMVGEFFDAFNAGDVERVLQLFTRDVTFGGFQDFGLLEETSRLEYQLAQGTILVDASCTADDTTTSAVICTAGIHDAPTQAIGANPIPTTIAFGLTPDGISRMAFQYGSPGFDQVGGAFNRWAETAHPETMTDDWDSPYRDMQYIGSDYFLSPVEAGQLGVLVAQYAQEWAASLAARGCEYPDRCYETP